MKLVFTADLHLDSAFLAEDANIRNAQLVLSFKNIVQYADKIGAGALLLGGDLFDTPYPSQETMAAVRDIIESYPTLQFLAVCGNHDPLYKTAFYDNVPKNFYVFPATPTAFELSDVTVYGVSQSSSEMTDVWQGFHTAGRFISLSHGDLYPATLSDSGAELCLLGHIHKTEICTLQSGAKALYCGTPAGRGFDECGKKGFYVIDTYNMAFEFIQSGATEYAEYFVDISDIASAPELLTKLTGITTGDNEIARAVLTGEVENPFTIDCTKLCSLLPAFVEVKDASQIKIDIMQSINDNTLEGEFVRILANQLATASEQDKAKIKDAIKEGVIALRRK